MPVCRAHRGAALALRWFDDGAVVFDEATGSLHALETTAAMALEQCLSGTGCTVSSLVRWLEDTHGLVVDAATVEAWLDTFEALNFVTRRL